jgi:hypothetical protein
MDYLGRPEETGTTGELGETTVIGGVTTTTDATLSFTVDDATWITGIDYDGTSNRPYKIARTAFGAGDAISIDGATKNLTVGGDAYVGVGAGFLQHDNAGVVTSSGVTEHWEVKGDGTNYAYGPSALAGLTTGSDSIGVGNLALNANQSGSRVVAIGSNTFEKSSTIEDSIAIGFEAGQGSFGAATKNVYIGSGAAKSTASNGTAHNAVAIGYRSQNICRGGNYNTTVGSDSGRLLFNGLGNCLFGYQAGDGITSTSYNTCVGHQSEAGGVSNSIALGRGAVADASSQAVIGNTTLSQIKTMNTDTCDLGATSARLKDIYSNAFKAQIASAGNDTNNALEVKNIAGTVTVAVTGAGDLTAASTINGMSIISTGTENTLIGTDV